MWNRFVFGLGLLALGTLLACAAAVTPKPEADLSPDKKKESTAPLDLTYAPLRTYDEACSRCHGVDGRNFAGQFRHTTWKPMWLANKQMMTGPSSLKPTDADVTVMTQYMFAIQKDLPFASVTNGAAVSKGDAEALEGDARAGTEVRVTKDGATLAVVQDGEKWSVTPAPVPPFDIHLTRADKQAVIHFPDRQWSECVTPEPLR